MSILPKFENYQKTIWHCPRFQVNCSFWFVSYVPSPKVLCIFKLVSQLIFWKIFKTENLAEKLLGPGIKRVRASSMLFQILSKATWFLLSICFPTPPPTTGHRSRAILFTGQPDSDLATNAKVNCPINAPSNIGPIKTFSSLGAKGLQADRSYWLCSRY